MQVFGTGRLVPHGHHAIELPGLHLGHQPGPRPVMQLQRVAVLGQRGPGNGRDDAIAG